MIFHDNYQIAIDHKAKTEHIQEVQKGVVDFNKPFLGDKSRFCIFLKNGADEVVGGVSGYMWPDQKLLYLEHVYVHESLRGRGHGTKLMLEAEQEAIRHGCKSIVLDTFSFQAEGFYQKLGYERIGFIENHIGAFDHIFLRKTLDP